METKSFLLAASLLLSPALVQASDNVKHGSSAILCLRQVSDNSAYQLPQDILNVLSQTLTGLDRHGIWCPEGLGKRWIPFTKTVEAIKAFRDGKSSNAEIRAVLGSKQQIKEGLLHAVSAQWDEGLEDLMKEHRQHDGHLNPGKAYGAAFLAYYMIDLSAAWNAARDAAWNAAQAAPRDAAWDAAWDAARNAARSVAWEAAWEAAWQVAWEAAWQVAWQAVHASVERKLRVLASGSASEISQISYDLAGIFTLLWLTENGHEYLKKAFDAAFNKFPEMGLAEVNARIEPAIKNPKLNDNMFTEALWRDLDTLEKFVLAK